MPTTKGIVILDKLYYQSNLFFPIDQSDERTQKCTFFRNILWTVKSKSVCVIIIPFSTTETWLIWSNLRLNQDQTNCFLLYTVQKIIFFLYAIEMFSYHFWPIGIQRRNSDLLNLTDALIMDTLKAISDKAYYFLN